MRVTSRLLAVVATVALPLAALGAAPTVASASPTAITPAKVLDCQGDRAEVRPRVLLIACGDGGLGVARLHWLQWGTRRAHAVGKLFVNDCTPNCAEGHFHFVPADVVLTRLHGGRYHYVTITSPRHAYRTIRQSLPQ